MEPRVVLWESSSSLWGEEDYLTGSITHENCFSADGAA
jgi:hypothetical protein